MQWKCVFSQFEGLEVQDQGGGRALSPEASLLGRLLPVSPRGLPPMSGCALISSYKDTSHNELGRTPTRSHYLNHLFTDSVPQNSHIREYQGSGCPRAFLGGVHVHFWEGHHSAHTSPDGLFTQQIQTNCQETQSLCEFQLRSVPSWESPTDMDGLPPRRWPRPPFPACTCCCRQGPPTPSSLFLCH